MTDWLVIFAAAYSYFRVEIAAITADCKPNKIGGFKERRACGCEVISL